MDIKEIKQLIDLMRRYELAEFELEEQAFKIRLKREPRGAAAARAAAPPIVLETPLGLGVGTAAAPAATPAPFAAPGNGNGHPAPAAPADEPGIVLIKSPMVGTFYRAQSPDAKPFVEPGTVVAPETVVCIIEAMKVMNEIQAEVKGVIKEVLVENGQAIEYGQALFKVKAG